MPQPAPYRPLPVVPGHSHYARKVWWRGFELTPGVASRPARACVPAWRPGRRPPRFAAGLGAGGQRRLEPAPAPELLHLLGQFDLAGEPARVEWLWRTRISPATSPPSADAHRLSWAELFKDVTLVAGAPRVTGGTQAGKDAGETPGRASHSLRSKPDRRS